MFSSRSLFRLLLAAPALALVLTLVGPISSADAAPAVVVKAAKKMHCGHRHSDYLIGPKNAGVTCRVRHHGKFYVLKYKNPKRGIRYLRNWVMGDHQFIARRAKILVIPAGPGDWYKKKTARYAARRLRGHVVRLS